MVVDLRSRATVKSVSASSGVGVRWRSRSLLAFLVVVTLALVAVQLFPRLRAAMGQATHLPAPAWPWIALAMLAIAGSYWLSALALQVVVGERLPMRRTVVVQLAAAVANRLTPGSVGGAAINVRYLTNLGYGVGEAGAAVTATGIAHVFVAVFGLMLFGPAALSRDARNVVGWLGGSWLWLSLAAAAIGLVAAIVVRRGRGRPTRIAGLRGAVVDGVRTMRALSTQPGRVVKLLLYVGAVKAANLLALYATLWAFDGDVAGWRVAVAYLVGATSAEAIPSPGGLGTVDAALLLALVGAAGSSAGAVLAGVVVYRLLAFWAPIMPGMVGSAFLRRRAVL